MKSKQIVKVLVWVLVAALFFLAFTFVRSCHTGNDPQGEDDVQPTRAHVLSVPHGPDAMPRRDAA